LGLTHLLLPKRSYLRYFDEFLKLIILDYKVNKMANASSLNLSELLLPSIQVDSIRYEYCQFNMKRKGKQAAYFKCITKDCQASLSLNLKDDVIIEPFNITNSNSVHKYVTCKKDDNFFNVRIFYQSAKNSFSCLQKESLSIVFLILYICQS
jgi:hypothetical protein